MSGVDMYLHAVQVDPYRCRLHTTAYTASSHPMVASRSKAQLLAYVLFLSQKESSGTEKTLGVWHVPCPKSQSPGQMVIPTVVGILGPSIASLRFMFKALLSTEPWLHDPEVLAIPYRSHAEYNLAKSPKLSFGVFPADGVVTPHPPILRAVREVAEAMEAEGYKVGAVESSTGCRIY